MLRPIIFAVLILFGITAGCKKSNSDTYSPYMNAVVNDSAFSTIDPQHLSANSTLAGGNTYLYIYGDDSYGAEIKLALINISSTGDYPFNGGKAAAYYYPFGVTNPFSQAISGSVIFTSLSPHLEGTFNFNCADGTQVKNGSFSVLAP